MKRFLTFSIILSSFFFSSIFSVNAQSGYLESLLDLNYGIESYQLENIPKLEAKSFSSPAVQQTYNSFLKVDSTLRAEFIKQYRAWTLSAYQVQDIITSYGNFIYNTQKTFLYISENEKGTRGTEIQTAISNGYSQMRMSYTKVKGIIQ